jgi:hypothetical protein
LLGNTRCRPLQKPFDGFRQLRNVLPYRGQMRRGVFVDLPLSNRTLGLVG